MTTPAKPQPKSVTHDLSEYLFFSPNTKGLSGSPVKIRADLFMDFFCNVDPETHDGQSVIRDIESLKIFGKTAGQSSQVSVPAKNDSASHKNRLNRISQTLSVLSFNQSTSPEKTFATKNVRVFYRVLQQEGDAFPTVYISDIRVVQRGRDNVGGLYEYVSTRTGDELLKAKNNHLDGKTVYISGASDSIREAMTSAEANVKDKTPALFFCPKQTAEDMGLFNKDRVSSSTKALVQELSNLLQQNQTKKVAWYAEGEGAAILSKALVQISGNLENHSFRFINARSNLPKLLEELGKRKAQMHGEFLDYTRDRKALISIANQTNDISVQLKNLPTKSGYDQISRRYLVDYFKALGENGNAKALLARALSVRGSLTTFIEAIKIAHKGYK